jgi:hypothetical protein
MTKLMMAMHTHTGRPMVEVYDDAGAFVACVYAMPDNCIHVVSKYFAAEPVEVTGADPAGFVIQFERREL